MQIGREFLEVCVRTFACTVNNQFYVLRGGETLNHVELPIL